MIGEIDMLNGFVGRIENLLEIQGNGFQFGKETFVSLTRQG